MRKTALRVITLILAVILALGLLSGMFAMRSWAATPKYTAIGGETTLSPYPLTVGTEAGGITIKFNFTPTTNWTYGSSISAASINSLGSSFETTSSTTLTITPEPSGTNVQYYSATLSDVKYTGGTSERLDIEINNDYVFYVKMPSGYFRNNQTSGSQDYLYKVITADTKVSQTLAVGKVSSGLTVTFSFLPDQVPPDSEITFERLSMPPDSSFGWTSKTKLKFDPVKVSGSVEYYKATLSNVSYTGGSLKTLDLYIDDIHSFSVPIPNKYFRENSSGTDELPTSDIIVQSVAVKNADGQKLAAIDKNTPPFTVEVTFYDAGLINESKSRLEAAKIHAFVTSSPGFKTLGGTGGTVELLTSNQSYPRFRAKFENIQSDGTGNTLNFRVQYELPDYEKSIKGEKAAELFQVEKEESESANSTLKPNVIVDQYSYGKDEIVAGDTFDLDLRFANTSSDIGVENLVMTIEPGNGFIIAAASNTVYFPALAPGEAKPFSIALRAAAAGNNAAAGTAGAQTDYSVQVKFSYQYLNKKEYLPGETAVKIAIPVIQLDRFSVDEITDYSQYMTAGEEGYISVPISNKGKSPVYNITGSVESTTAAEGSYIAPVVNFGNLEAGKNGTVDLNITISVPGEFSGSALIAYEDENMNQKHVSVPFLIMVNEAYMPPQETPPENPGEIKSAAPPLFSIIFCVLGSLLIAAPIALYLIKRAKLRGSEDADEDF